MSVVFKNKSIMIDGKPTYIFSGEIQSFRLPYDQWKDRLEKMKAMGLNSIGTYFAWNFHSQVPNQADFTSPQRDIGKFLDMAAALELYVIVRPGPYICNEWDLGGYPGWLMSEESGDWRTGHPDHLKWCKQWYKDVNTIIAPRQQTKGGPVILYQVENEHFWGEKEFLEGLAMQAMEDGIEVPLVSNCGGSVYETGTNHIVDGIDIYTPVYEQWRWRGWFDKLYRTLPEDMAMMILEYAGGSTCFWGELEPDEVKFPSEWLVSMTGMFMGKGANLTNFFVAAGGVTPCGYSSDHMSTNYMENAAIAHWGGLGRKFYLTRLWAEAINSVNEVFSTSKPWDINWGTDNPNVECLARKSPNGTFFFVFNNTLRWEEYRIALLDGSKLPNIGVMKIKPKNSQLLMGNLKLTEKTGLDFCSTQIMKIWYTGKNVNIVTYDKDGNEGCLFITSDSKKYKLSYTCSDNINVSFLSCYDCEIKIFAISAQIAEKTWFINNEDEAIPLFSNIELIRPGRDEKGNLRAEVKTGKIVKIITSSSESLVVNGNIITGENRCDGLRQFSFGSEISGKMEFTISAPKYKAESGLWRMEDIGQKSEWKKIRPFDGISDCLTETGYYQYRTDFEVIDKLPSTIEFTGITGIEAEFFLNGYKLGVFPEQRPNAYHSLKEFCVSFNVEGFIKKGINKIAIACNLIGRHNLGRPIYTGINRPVVLYDRKDEIDIVYWKESSREAIPTDMEQLKNIPQQALVCFDDSEWALMDVSKRRNIPCDEFTNWHDVQWYRTRYKLPATMLGKPLFLKLPRIAEAWIYVEGQLVGMINEHHSTTVDISAFSSIEEINIAVALRYLNWFRPSVLTQAPTLFTVDQVLQEEWHVRKESEEDKRKWMENCEEWKNGHPDPSDTRLWYKYEITVKRPEDLIAPIYVELDDNWKTHATIYWNGYPIGMYASVGPDRRFYIQDGIIEDVNSLIILVEGYNTSSQCGNIALGAYEELVPLRIKL